MTLVTRRSAYCSWSRRHCTYIFVVLLYVLLCIGSGGCVSSCSSGDEVLEHVPVTPFQPDSRLSVHLAAFYQPSPTGSMIVSMDYGFAISRFEGLVSLSMPEGNLTKFVEVNAFPITSSENRVPTWYRLAVLDFSILKAPCNNPAYFLPAMAVTPDQQQLVFFGFGPLPECNNVFIWKHGSKLREIQTSNGGKVAHALHAIAISETTETLASSEVKKKVLHVFSYGGMSCDCFANTNSHEFVACVRQCKRISRTLWKLTFSQSQQDQGDRRWEEVVMSPPTPSRYAPPPLLRPSLNVQRSTSSNVVMLCGGLEVLPAGRLENLTHSDDRFIPNTQRWLGSMHIRKWQQWGRRSTRATSDVPFIPRCAFSPATYRLGMVDFRLMHGGRMSLILDHLNITAKGTEKHTFVQIYRRVIGRQFQKFLIFTATYDLWFFVRLLTSARVFGVRILETLNYHRLTIREVTQYSSLSHRFPGSSSCYCPLPVQLLDTSFVNKKYLVVGGSCRPVALQNSDYDLTPTIMYMWAVELMDGHAIYNVRTISSGFLARPAEDTFGYTVTPLENNLAVIVGGFTQTNRKSYNDIYLYVVKIGLDTDYLSRHRVLRTPNRAFHIAFRHNSSSLIIHGGIHQISNTSTSKNTILCDIWILSIDESASKAIGAELTSRVE